MVNIKELVGVGYKTYLIWGRARDKLLHGDLIVFWKVLGVNQHNILYKGLDEQSELSMIVK